VLTDLFLAFATIEMVVDQVSNTSPLLTQFHADYEKKTNG